MVFFANSQTIFLLVSTGYLCSGGQKLRDDLNAVGVLQRKRFKLKASEKMDESRVFSMFSPLLSHLVLVLICYHVCLCVFYVVCVSLCDPLRLCFMSWVYFLGLCVRFAYFCVFLSLCCVFVFVSVKFLMFVLCCVFVLVCLLVISVRCCFCFACY